MKNQTESAAARDAALREDPSPTADIRAALTLAKVALQTLVDSSPETASAVDHALAHEIERAKRDDSADRKSVVNVLTDARARLAGEDTGEPHGGDAVWYIE
jgi:hypothetical protein